MSDAPPPPSWDPADQPPPPPAPPVPPAAPAWNDPPTQQGQPQWGAPPQTAYQPMPVANDPRKSKLAAGLIAILIPGLGIHNFYLGYTGKGIAQLVLTLTCIGYIFSVIWSIVEGIMILTGSINTDANGVPLKD
jgi:TM2 domain-containing membrane protein YozV